MISQIPTEKQLIPATFDESDKLNSQYDYEPDEDVILADLLRINYNSSFTGLLGNCIRTRSKNVAMDNATRNAVDMIDKLAIQFNHLDRLQLLMN